MDARVGRDCANSLRIVYADDPDTMQAGQGLQYFPLIAEALGKPSTIQYWMMSPAEQVALAFLLGQLRPKVAIEIGTRFGGSLQVLFHYSDLVYSIDVDPEVPTRLTERFPKVKFLTGPSDEILPSLIDRLQREKCEVSFALVDGDHSTEGVRRDINNLLRFQPVVPLYVVMHDSSNGACRQGLRQAKWAANPHVHAVELDFVPGCVNPSPAFRGGLALGILLPYERSGRFEVTARSEQTLKAVARGQTALYRRVGRRIKRSILGHPQED